MDNHRFILEKYNGPRSRHTCPACGKSNEFVKYVDQADGSHLDKTVGRCNRQESCGYHYTPSQYFADGGQRPEGGFLPPRTIPKDPSFMDQSLVSGSMRSYDNNTLVQFLLSKYDADKVWQAVNDYRIGSSKYFDNSTVFWQIDQQGRIHAGKVMKYDNTGHRVKTEGRALITWVHSLLKLENYNLQQCYFGQHLITDNPVCIVESEKTAVVCSIEVPDFTWIATGGINGARWTEKSVSGCLDGKSVVMYPDAGCAGEWAEKSQKLPYDITVSEMLESYPAGYDLADFFFDNTDTSCIDTSEPDRPGESASPAVFIDDLIRKAEAGEQLDKSEQKRAGEYFASKNPHYLQLIDALELEYGEPIELKQYSF